MYASTFEAWAVKSGFGDQSSILCDSGSLYLAGNDLIFVGCTRTDQYANCIANPMYCFYENFTVVLNGSALTPAVCDSTSHCSTGGQLYIHGTVSGHFDPLDPTATSTKTCEVGALGPVGYEDNWDIPGDIVTTADAYLISGQPIDIKGAVSVVDPFADYACPQP
jgi:hypothetical protein